MVASIVRFSSGFIMTKITYVHKLNQYIVMQLSAFLLMYINAENQNMKDAKNWGEIAEVMKSVAHSERLAILHLLSNCGRDKMVVKEFYERLHLQQSVASRHLGIMRKSGLLKREIIDGRIFYRFNEGNTTGQCMRRFLMR